MTSIRPIDQTIAFLRERVTRAPHAILVLGSGLGGLADEIEDAVRIPFGDIPGFPQRTQELAGHAGALVVGRMEGVEVATMQGRFHLYEGWNPADVALPVRALAALGAETMLLTNAAGGIRPGMQPGDLMVIADHLNMMGKNPLIGAQLPGEERFPDMSDPYDAGFRRIAEQVALQLRIPVTQGVYAAMLGPSYETPAEVRMLARLGADAVGMSTVPEVIVARALGVKCLGVSCITNLAAGLGGEHLSHTEVMEVGARVRDQLAALVRGVLPRIAGLNRASEAAS
ncbi:MAG TPA: purine-nucleoside phosphorylase [Longimicrobiaceae bacterium]|jgi:purine-nucleoside phosphorylase|nr:purine-nucleoside phosphorylase [Longimicrobiaceae bacterium]